MLRRLWLIFAQTTTIGLAALFVVATLRPDWLARTPLAAPVPEPQIRIAPAALHADEGPTSYAEAVRAAAPAVVNVYTTQAKRRDGGDDPLIQRFFGRTDGGCGNQGAVNLDKWR